MESASDEPIMYYRLHFGLEVCGCGACVITTPCLIAPPRTSMGNNRTSWLKDYSALVDCMNVALSNGRLLRMIEGGRLGEILFAVLIIVDLLLREHPIMLGVSHKSEPLSQLRELGNGPRLMSGPEYTGDPLRRSRKEGV